MAELWAGFAVFQELLLIVFTAWLVRYFALRGMSIVYMASVHVTWLLGFAGTLLLPIDVAQSRPGEPSSPVMETFWMFVYWSTFLLTWIIVPLLQEYSAAGQFHFKGKFLESIKQNLIFYGAIGVCGIGFLIWIIVANNIGKEDLPKFVFSLATTFGLLNIVLFMGYGLVEVPRMVWRASNAEKALRRSFFKASDLDQELFDTRCVVEELIAEVQSVKNKLPPRDSPDGLNLLKCYETILAKSESISSNALTSSFRNPRSSSDSQIPDVITEKYLAKLHFRLKREGAKLMKAQHRWDSCVEDCRIYETIIAGTVPPAPENLAASGRLSLAASTWHVILWRWRLHYAPVAYKVFAGFCAFMSVVTLWCECVQPFKHDLSLIAQTVEAVDSFMWKHIVSLVFLLYICWCTFLCIFRLKLFGLLELSGNRQTDAYSLCFNAAFMCRLQFAISYNFLQMTTMGVQTDFEKSVGKNMMLIPGINQYVPVIIGVFALLTLFDAFERTLRLFGIDQKGEPRKGNVEDEEKIEEGKSLVSRARQRTISSGNSASRSTPLRTEKALNFDLKSIRTPTRDPEAVDPKPSVAAPAPTGPAPAKLSGLLSKFSVGSSSSAPTAHDDDEPDESVTARTKLYNPPPRVVAPVQPPLAPLKPTIFAPKQSLSSFMSGNKS